MLITSVYMKIPILYLRKNHMTFCLYRKIWSDFTKPRLAFKQHTKTSDSQPITVRCSLFVLIVYRRKKILAITQKIGILDSNVLIQD